MVESALVQERGLTLRATEHLGLGSFHFTSEPGRRVSHQALRADFLVFPIFFFFLFSTRAQRR